MSEWSEEVERTNRRNQQRKWYQPKPGMSPQRRLPNEPHRSFDDRKKPDASDGGPSELA